MCSGACVCVCMCVFRSPYVNLALGVGVGWKGRFFVYGTGGYLCVCVPLFAECWFQGAVGEGWVHGTQPVLLSS